MLMKVRVRPCRAIQSGFQSDDDLIKVTHQKIYFNITSRKLLASYLWYICNNLIYHESRQRMVTGAIKEYIEGIKIFRRQL